jgi:hypothetical protein
LPVSADHGNGKVVPPCHGLEADDLVPPCSLGPAACGPNHDPVAVNLVAPKRRFVGGYVAVGRPGNFVLASIGGSADITLR